MLGSQGKGHKKKQTRKRGAKSSKKFQKGDCQPHSKVAVRADVCATPVKHDKVASTVVSRCARDLLRAPYMSPSVQRPPGCSACRRFPEGLASVLLLEDMRRAISACAC